MADETKAWIGEASRFRDEISDGAFEKAAGRLGCDVAAVRAVFQVESSGRLWMDEPQKGVLRRFEPHHTSLINPKTGKKFHWRESLKLSRNERERLFQKCWEHNSEEARDATSWGAAQIMGFNAEACGYTDDYAMIKAMANNADEHVQAFVGFCVSRNLQSAFVAHDWFEIAAKYNGPGKAADYAAKIERAYRRVSGQGTLEVLRRGDRGPAVKRLQKALDVRPDGKFGADTEAALQAFQRRNDLHPDGIAGRKTWDALDSHTTAAKPPAKKDPVDLNVDKVERMAKLATPATGLLSAVGGMIDGMPQVVQVALFGSLGVCAVALACAFAWRIARRTS